MSLTLHFHPLSSFCHKVLTALYENGTPFEPHIVNLGDEASSAELKRLWPIGKFPVLRDETNDRTIPESSIIIEYLAEQAIQTLAFVLAFARQVVVRFQPADVQRFHQPILLSTPKQIGRAHV